MADTNFAIPINNDIGSQAQAILNDRGLDIVTVVDNFLRQIVYTKGFITELSAFNMVTSTKHNDDGSFLDLDKVIGKPVKYGGWEGKITMSDDFNAPIDDFEEYM